MKRIKTARGKILDMGALATKHEQTRAVSNVPVNARGDIIDNRGNVTVSREEISKKYYDETVPGADTQEVSIKEEDEAPKKKKTSKKKTPLRRKINQKTTTSTKKQRNKKKINPSNQNSTWLVPTSGTTSLPKLVSHTLGSLGASSLRLRKISEQNKIWGQFYDFTRYAGYQVLLNSLLNGHTLVTSSLKDPIHERVKRCAEECVTHISATPSQWRKILMTGGVAKRIPLEQIVLGGEAADQQILSALSSFYPEAKITHTYASTEAGLGLSVSDRLAGFPTRFFDNSEGLSEISVRSGRLFLRTTSIGVSINSLYCLIVFFLSLIHI